MPGAYLAMMEPSRIRQGFTVEQAARRLRITVRSYEALLDGVYRPGSELWRRMVEVFQWPRAWGSPDGVKVATWTRPRSRRKPASSSWTT